jgi:ABC-type uncharacterized transport system substrate-binding protein
MRNYILTFIFLFGVFNFSCNRKQQSDQLARIFYVNSYHTGYGSSDDVMEGMHETFRGKNLLLKTFLLDAKRKSTEKERNEMVQKALEEIEKFNPGLLIVSDDNAVKDLVVPHFNHTSLPVIFCGVNWSASEYNLGKNVTGMLEVLPLRECLSEVIINYPETKNLVVLSENSLSEQNNKNLLDTLYRNLNLEVTYSLADDFETWKALFLEAGETADLIYMPTNGAVKNWDEKEAISFVRNNLNIPAVTCDDFMMPYAVFGLTKVAREQGEWAAKTALEISGGRKPAEIPYTKNSQTKAWINKTLAEKIDFKLSEEMNQRVTCF